MIHDATNRSRRSFRSTSHAPDPDPAGPATPAIAPETATAVLVVLIVYPFQQGGRSGTNGGSPDVLFVERTPVIVTGDPERAVAGVASVLRGREEPPQHPGQGSAFRLRPPGQQGFLQFDQRPEGLVDGPAAGGGELD